MLKPFRIVHYPVFIAVIFLICLFLLNFNSSNSALFTKENQFEYISREIISENGLGGKYSQKRRDFNITRDRGTILFTNRGQRTSFRTEKNVKDLLKLKNGEADKVLFPGLRFVHLDLKGAPPRITYLKKLLPIISGLGANGLLIEYEDMFPYSSGNFQARNAYTKKGIQELLKIAKENNLQVIPLLQTFGHAEFVLKLKDYKHLREDPRYPQAYCPSKNETLKVLEGMINNILDAHPDSKYFHIGCDEVVQLGECNLCRQAMEINNWTKRQLFLNHVRTIAEYVNTNYPNVQVLMWDDELRDWSIAELEDSGLGRLVHPVVWKYTTDVPSSFPPSFWTKYSTVFKHVWIASAFKGAAASDATALELDVYTMNHEAWMETVQTNTKYVDFVGIILTGWQRYDHFSVLCELLPVGFPSLAINLAYLAGSDRSIEQVENKVRDVLNCDTSLSFMPVKWRSGVTNRCRFPGSEIYEAVSLLPSFKEEIKQMKETSAFRGWFSKYNIKKYFSSPTLIEQATGELDKISIGLASLELKLTETMEDVYDKYTIDEWISTHLRPYQDEIKALMKARSNLLYRDDWPRRPLIESKMQNP